VIKEFVNSLDGLWIILRINLLNSSSSSEDYIGWMYLISNSSQSDSCIFACSKSR